MNVCILSMQRIDNMGSLLQAYALKKILEDLGLEVAYLDIKKIKEDYELLGDRRLQFNSEQEKQGRFGKLSRVDAYVLDRIRNRLAARRQTALFERFRAVALNLDKTWREYDLCVIGSDEVFNCLGAGYWGFSSQLFGNVPEAHRIITYAASCGATTYFDLPPCLVNRIRETFQRISSFSVRDRNTMDFVKRLTDQEVFEHLDPVLIYDFSEELEQAQLPRLPNRYCLIYAYVNRIHNSEDIRAILEFCRRHQMIPVSVGASQFWCKKHITCLPFSCMKMFENAAYVITDTFHGTIFSVKYAKRFAVLPRKSNQNKLLDIADRLEIRNHFISNASQLEESYHRTEKDVGRIQSILEVEKSCALSYLRRSIFDARQE